MRPALVFIALLCSCQGNGGAVNVRWEIVDLTSGMRFSPSDVGGPSGVCTQNMPPPTWTIDTVELMIAQPDAVSPTCATQQCIQFPCSQREATTSFSLATGPFALSLLAHSPDAKTVTPAPAVRMIKAREVVNLDVVEIGIHPLPLVPFDAGEPDLANADRGPIM